MGLIVDLHIHSRFSRATSKQLTLPVIYHWAKIKGIDVIGTGDFTHPLWLKEIKEQLVPAEPGLFKLKSSLAKKEDNGLPKILRSRQVRFILTSEISNIYSRHGQTRRMHNILIAPGISSASKIISRLSKIGNLTSDGRPILGLDSQELLQISLQTDPDNFFIPAHVWTPWFSLFGSKSGFDSVEEAFGHLSPHITAMETGLSSDPFMNWRWSALDHITFVSNSDAHSPQKLGREASLINTDLNYHQIISAIKTGKNFIGTIEFFPQEGRYYYDGHRACNVVFSPAQSKKRKNICPKCGKPLVLGVAHRVNSLSDRPPSFRPQKHKKVEYIIPLSELIAEARGVKSVNSITVQKQYFQLLSLLGDEFSILRAISPSDIKAFIPPDIARALLALRQGKVHIRPGYDGVYGIISTKSSSDKKQMTFL